MGPVKLATALGAFWVVVGFAAGLFIALQLTFYVPTLWVDHETATQLYGQSSAQIKT